MIYIITTWFFIQSCKEWSIVNCSMEFNGLTMHVVNIPVVIIPVALQDLFQGGLGIITTYKTQLLAIYITLFTLSLYKQSALITYSAWNYSLLAAVPAASTHNVTICVHGYCPNDALIVCFQNVSMPLLISHHVNTNYNHYW